MRIALATCQQVPELYESEQYLLNGLSAYAAVGAVVWNDEAINWSEFDMVIIRSTWDYHEHFTAFTNWLNHLEALKVKVLNPVSIIKNNIHKFYLKELQENGLPIIPTYFLTKQEALHFSLLDLAKERNWGSIVVKPAISASAWHTYKLVDLAQIESFKFPIESDWLIQPFMKEITTHGEISLMYFNNQFSHAVVKNAKKGDFRIQKEFGGNVALFNPSTQVISTADSIITHYNAPLLYSRIDGIITENGFKIMEVELIEPELYLLNEELQNNFRQAIKVALS